MPSSIASYLSPSYRAGAGGLGHGAARRKLLRGRPPAQLDSRRRTTGVDGVHDQSAAGWDRKALGSAVAGRVGAGDSASEAMRYVGVGEQHERACRDASRRGVHVNTQVAGDYRGIGGQLLVTRV